MSKFILVDYLIDMVKIDKAILMCSHIIINYMIFLNQLWTKGKTSRSIFFGVIKL